MISAWHLLWIIPLAASGGAFWITLFIGSSRQNRKDEKHDRT